MELTTEEFNKIRAGMKSAWPSANIMPDEFTIKLWYGMLKDIPYNVCSSAIMELMSVEKFAPSIAQIREKCLEYTDIPMKDVSEAWSDVMSAVHRYGYYSVPEAMDSLDELTRQAVKGIGFKTICMSENIMVERAHFMRIYETLKARKKADMSLPAAVSANKARLIGLLRNDKGKLTGDTE